MYIKNFFAKEFKKAYDLNRSNILNLMSKDTSAVLLDLGCDSGWWTEQIAKVVCPKKLIGLDVSEERLKIAASCGISTLQGDLSLGIPMEDESASIIHANQVIEHLPDLHLFGNELFRVLKKGGYVIISTENTSSWHNIFAAVLGWQMFSLTNVSPIRGGLGNPLAHFRNNDACYVNSHWTHKTVFGFLGLKEFFEAYGFRVESIRGAGYYPFSSKIGLLDPKHAHFLTIKAYKDA